MINQWARTLQTSTDGTPGAVHAWRGGLGGEIVRRLRVDPPDHGALRAILASNLALAVLLHCAQRGVLALSKRPQHSPVLELVHGWRDNKRPGQRLACDSPPG
jgi:hypothetical protein